MPLYTTKQAADAAGCSTATVRNVTSGPFADAYRGMFSPGATPGKGTARVFTGDDVKLLAYIRQETASGASHTEVAQRIRAGELEAFEWDEPQTTEMPHAPQEPRQAATASPGETTPNQAALVLAQTLSTALEAARTREVELWEKLLAAEQRATAAETELRLLREKETAPTTNIPWPKTEIPPGWRNQPEEPRRPWWRRLFGG